MLTRLWRAWRARNDDWHMADIQPRIDQNGWTAIYVGDYHSVPSWAYSVGFHSSLAAPEIIVFDVPQDVANNLFWEVYEELKSGQLALRDGERWRADQTETPLVWRKVHPSQLQNEETIWLGLAETFQLILRPQDMFEAFQLVLPDPQGRLPWDAGYDERLRERQPALWEPAELAADGPV